MDPLIWIVALGAVVAGFVQGLSGFAFGLVAMSFWAWTVEPRLAAPVVVFGGLTGQVVAAFSVRRGFDRKLVMPFIAGGLAGIPIGVGLLPLLDLHRFKAVLGVVLVVWCPLMLAARQLPRIPFLGPVLDRGADGTVGLIGGIMGGIGGFTGVAPTLWCTLRGMDKDAQRAVIQNFNLATLAATMAIYIATGVVTTDTLPLFAVVAPAMLVPTYLGAKLYLGLSEAAFRKIVLTLLTASGIALLSSALPTVVGRL